MDKTINFYNQNANDYTAETVNLDMAVLYKYFVPYVKNRGFVVDLGCGSGRDGEYFSQRGFEVLLVDGARKILEQSIARTGLPGQHATFAEFTAPKPADGIWANASLLHVPQKELPRVIQHLAEQLAKDGVIFASFKDLDAPFTDPKTGRYYNAPTKQQLLDMLHKSGLSLEQYAHVPDTTRPNVMWHIIVGRKS